MRSVQQMFSQLRGLIDTTVLTPWENQFLKDVIGEEDGAAVTATGKQIEILSNLWEKHFA